MCAALRHRFYDLYGAAMRGLRPSTVLRQRVQAVKAQLRARAVQAGSVGPTAAAATTTAASAAAAAASTLAPALAHPLRYGCLHARVETDMVKSWRVNRAGYPPSAHDFLGAMGRTTALHSTPVVFVAVGLAISSASGEAHTQCTTCTHAVHLPSVYPRCALLRLCAVCGTGERRRPLARRQLGRAARALHVG